MPKLTDPILEAADRACRAFASQERERVKTMENPGMREPMAFSHALGCTGWGVKTAYHGDSRNVR